MFRTSSALCCVVCLIYAVLPVLPLRVFAFSYVEDFTTMQYCDTANTTAWWDTLAGEVKLHPFEITLAGSCDTPGGAQGIAISGDYAYVADGFSGLQVIGIRDPTNPALAGSYATPGNAQGIAISGDYAYVAAATSGLQVIDISDPTAPAFGGSCDTPGNAWGVAISGDYTYIADFGSGLQVIDISDPTAPALAGGYDTPGEAQDVAISGDYAYVAGGSSGLQVIDISDPTIPAPAGSYNTPGYAYGIAISGDCAYIADGTSGLQVIDISDPTSPAFAGSYNTPGYAYGVRISGDHAYIADGTSGLQVIDISDPTAPALGGSYDTPGSALGVGLSGDYAYVADGTSGLEVMDIADVAAPALAGGCDPGAEALGVAISGDYAYVAYALSGLQVIVISDPTAPAFAGSCDTPNYAVGVGTSGDYACVADGPYGLQVINISDPTAPAFAGSCDTPGYAYGVAISGDYAYVADAYSGLQVIDISDPTAPAFAGSYDTPGNANAIAISGDYAYVADGTNGLQVIDISDPTNPAFAGSYDTPDYACRVTISGDYAYVTDADSGLQVIDISDPTAPAFAGSYHTPGNANAIAISGDYAFVTERFGLKVLDISDPTAPAFAGSCDAAGYGRAIAISGDYTYTADGAAGLHVIEVFQRRFYTDSNTARSLSVDGTDELIVRVRLSSTQTDSIRWEVSADNGGDWQEFLPGGPYRALLVPGSDLVWRSLHVYRPSHPRVNPACTSLEIEWLYTCATIDSIVDVPSDQGGWAYLYFTRSGYDIAEEDSIPVSEYFVYRRIDESVLRRSPSEQERAAGGVASSMPATIEERVKLPSWLRPRDVIYHDGGYCIVSDGTGPVGLPPGTWAVVGNVPAHQEDQNICLVPTVADSSATLVYSVYCVSAETTTPSIYFVSPPDSGYSIDNLAPAPPPGLTMSSPTELAWEEVPDEDFDYYSVYGSDEPELDETAVLIGYTIDVTKDIAGHVYDYYHVTATDFAGNEGEESSVENTFAGGPGPEDAEDIPTAFALGQNRPNPFSGATVIAFDIPESAAARVAIYDTHGRIIRTLTNNKYKPGRYEVTWQGLDQAGNSVGPGVYFIRLEAGEFKDTKKVMLLR